MVEWNRTLPTRDSQEDSTMPTAPCPRVKLEAVRVRDAQRRLRLVIDLLAQESCRQAGRLRSPAAHLANPPVRASRVVHPQPEGEQV